MKQTTAFISIIIISALFSNTIFAELTSPSVIRGDQPIHLKADELTTDNNKKTAVFSGNVVARQGDVVIYCDKLVIHYGEKEREVDKVEAFGKVRFTQGNRQGQSDRATYDNRSGTILLEGNPKVFQGDNMEAEGKTILFNLNDQKSRITGDQDKRVIVTIDPKGLKSNAPKKP